MKKVFKRNIFIIMLCFIAGGVTMGCRFFPGLFFPRIKFDFYIIGDKPPSAHSERLALGGKFPQTFKLYFDNSLNSFESYIYADLFVNKPYKKLHIKEIRCLYMENIYVMTKNEIINTDKNSYESLNDWYLIGYVGGCLFSANFEKIFKDKKPGDVFTCSFEIVYYFYEEAEKIQKLEYRVVTVEGKYRSILDGILG